MFQLPLDICQHGRREEQLRRVLPSPPAPHIPLRSLPFLQVRPPLLVMSLVWTFRISLCISIYLLVGVGIERFIAVCRPHHFRQVQTDNTRYQSRQTHRHTDTQTHRQTDRQVQTDNTMYHSGTLSINLIGSSHHSLLSPSNLSEKERLEVERIMYYENNSRFSSYNSGLYFISCLES